jgi:D-3-phosphoglycerate dehydrogenase
MIGRSTMTFAGHHIIVAETYDEKAVDRLRPLGRITLLERCDESTLVAAVADADALLVRTYAKVSRRVIEAGPRLRVIGRAGVGLENIDQEAAAEKGIAVVYTPAATTEAVADLAVGLMIGLVRDLVHVDRMVRHGAFREGREPSMAMEMSGQTLGIVGLGRIGKAVARRCALGFQMSVTYCDIVPPGPLDFPARSMRFDELVSTCDVVSMHVPLTRVTRGMINGNVLARMKPTAYLINTSRGAVVDSMALAEALVAGRLGGAALDVFEPEPLPLDHPLLCAPRTVFTPHIGARTALGQERMNDVVDDVIRVLRGEPPRFPAPEDQ